MVGNALRSLGASRRNDGFLSVGSCGLLWALLTDVVGMNLLMLLSAGRILERTKLQSHDGLWGSLTALLVSDLIPCVYS